LYEKKTLYVLVSIIWGCKLLSQWNTGIIVCVQTNESGLMTAKMQYAIDFCTSLGGGHDGLHSRFCLNFSVSRCDFRTGDDAFAGSSIAALPVRKCT